jgi:hypothetical protein
MHTIFGTAAARGPRADRCCTSVQIDATFLQQRQRSVPNPLDGPQGAFFLVVAQLVPVLVGVLYGIQSHENQFRVFFPTSLALQDDPLEGPAERLKIRMLRSVCLFDEVQQGPAGGDHGQV